MLYVDNDTILTLAELNILDLFCSALGEDHHEGNIFVLRGAWDSLDGHCDDSDVWERVEEFLKGTGPLSGHLLKETHEELRELQGIDMEAQLYACCANDPGSRVVTGDFTSVSALADRASPNTQRLLTGRVISTEQCILQIIAHAGFANVSGRWADSGIEHYIFTPMTRMSASDCDAHLRNRLDSRSAGVKTLLGWP